jgi:chorismate mutase
VTAKDRPIALLARQQRARARIDRVDEALLELLERRASIARHIAELRAVAGEPSRDEAREAELVAGRRRAAQGMGLDADDVEAVFRAVIRLCRHAQRAARAAKTVGGPEPAGVQPPKP